MKEIKFRAWDEKNNYWIYGDQPKNDDLFIENVNPKNNTIYEITHWKDTILMQYTGVKDKNGKEIYEGDIVQIKYALSSNKGIVEYIHDKYSINSKKYDMFYDYNGEKIFSWNELEIIGNIYENPELLE